jgi:hypothetical protein
MPALFFPNLNALRLALVSGLVPRNVSGAPAAAGFDGHGRLWLKPAEIPSREALAALSRIGVQVLGGPGVPTTPVDCWAAILPLYSTAPPPSSLVLFVVPDRDLSALTARLRRARALFGVRLTEGKPAGAALVAVRNPPSDVLAAAAEPGSRIAAFEEQSPGVWVECGWRHPAPDHLRVLESCVLTVRPPRELQSIEGVVPTPEPDQFPLRSGVVAADSSPHAGLAIPVRLWVSKRAPAAREALWVLDGAAELSFWEYCAGADERLLRRLEAATVGVGHDRRVVVRPEGGKARVVLPLAVAGFAADQAVPGLFVPAGRVLRPALRARDVARVLGVTPGRIVWVEQAGESVVAHALDASAFRPLAELINYTRPETVRLTPLPRHELFPLGRFVAPAEPLALPEEELEPAAGEEAVPPTPSARGRPARLLGALGRLGRALPSLVARLLPRARRAESGSVAAPVESVPTAQPENRVRVERNLASPDALLHGYDWAARRRELEARLFRDLPRLGPAGRAERWADLAAVYSATGNAPDAAVCWMNAVWESPAPPPAWLSQWLADECRAAKLPIGEGALER